MFDKPTEMGKDGGSLCDIFIPCIKILVNLLTILRDTKFIIGNESKSCRVDAITQPAGLAGTIVEHVTQMGIRAAAAHFRPDHTM